MTRHAEFNVNQVRQDFPILKERVNDKPLVYFDNAATTQKPVSVMNGVTEYYHHYNANVHRGLHTLSEKATLAYEKVRDKVRRFINAAHTKECIFTRGTTESINLVATSFLEPQIQAGDEIIISHLEHHSNIVPWQMLCKKTGAKLVVAPINIDGEIIIDEYKKCFNDKTVFVALSHVSNALGTVNPIKELTKIAKSHQVKVLIDGAQATPHYNIDVKDLDVDFYAFSSHKMYGPTGVGVLWGKAELLERMPPYQGGGEMISAVTFEQTEYAPLPHKFEAGTPNIAGVIGLGYAIDYLLDLGLDDIKYYESSLLNYAEECLRAVKGINIVGTAKEKCSLVSFVHGKIHAHDIGTILNSMGIAVRSGHHCAMPVMDFFDLSATTRASFSFYNTREEVDAFVEALNKAIEVLG